MTTHFKFLSLLLAAGVALQAQSQAPAPPNAAKDMLDIYGALKNHEIILKVGTLAMTKQEFSKTFERLRLSCDYDGENNAFEMAEAVRTSLGTLAQRGGCLLEARALKLEVTSEEQKDYEAELLEGLKKNGRAISLAGLRDSMGSAPSTLARVSYADALRLVKLQKTQVPMPEISAEELKTAKNYLRQVNSTIKNTNHETELLMQSYLADKSIHTDEGFKKLATENSQGQESVRGGVLDGEYTREELTEVNEGQPFTCKVGETSPVIVTTNNYRIIRVLAEIPPKDGETAPRYKVAQILHKRFAETELTDDAKIRENIDTNKRKKALDAYAQALAVKYLASSPLFPNGLWKK